MDEIILRDLWGKIVLSEIIGSYQKRELIYQEKSDKTLKIYIYCEKNHKRPHVHVHWKNEYKVSISISDCELLVGNMPNKNLKAIKEWVQQYDSKLLEAWYEIQAGNKPELNWVKNA
jgi:hypothetical protein